MKAYRIKEPRCWVLRWNCAILPHRYLTDHGDRDAIDGTYEEAERFESAAHAVGARAYRIWQGWCDKETWRIVRRGKVSQ